MADFRIAECAPNLLADTLFFFREPECELRVGRSTQDKSQQKHDWPEYRTCK
jgi:hypothetical protein